MTVDSAAWTGRRPLPWWGKLWGWDKTNAFYEPVGRVLIIELWRFKVGFAAGKLVYAQWL